MTVKLMPWDLDLVNICKEYIDMLDDERGETPAGFTYEERKERLFHILNDIQRYRNEIKGKKRNED